MEYNRLITGNEYSLKDLLSKDNKIIIPDLQRDYCWGTHNNLVKVFLSNLLNNTDKDLNMGLLYGYEAPLGHIQLCDGQQRITTLFLLLGMLNKRTDDSFRHFLISETEENDDWEPYLQYAIRESSLYFLSDLTKFFFIEGKDLNVSDIKQQHWYFKDYDFDPSIQDMIAAMKIIEGEIKNINCLEFGKFILEKLSFLYYDMENRTKGEETFVVINTTGEPLSATENLKPMLISRQPKEDQKVCAEKWEKWEQFFWKNRGKNDIANNGLNEFFRWVMLLNLDVECEEFKQIQVNGKFKFNLNIEFDKIDKYFKIVSECLFGEKIAIFPKNKEWLAPDTDGNSQIVWFRILPVLEYIKHYPDATDRDVYRVRMFFRNLSKVPKVKNDLYNRDMGRLCKVLPDAIRMIKKLPNKDICSLLEIDGVSQTLISDEVKFKLKIYRDAYNRDEIENAFWKEEESELWSGEILPMIEWATTDGGFDYDLFKTYRDKFNKIFHDNLEYKELDVTRRALLTHDLNDYPRIFKGYTNWCFAWDYEDWKTLINDNVDKFKSFLDELDINDIYKAQYDMIANNPSDKYYDEFVKIPELLEYCEQKKIQWWGKDLGWTLIKGDRASGEYANLKSYRLYLEMRNKIKECYLWFYGSEGSCAVIDETKNMDTWAIDVWHSGNDKYALQLFRRKGHQENSFGDLPQKLGLSWNGKRYEKKDMEKDDAIDKAKEIIASLMK